MTQPDAETKSRIERVVNDLENCIEIVSPIFDDEADAIDKRICFPPYFFGFFCGACDAHGLSANDYQSIFSFAVCDWLGIDFEKNVEFTQACVDFSLAAVGTNPWAASRQAGYAAYGHFKRKVTTQVEASFRYTLDTAPSSQSPKGSHAKLVDAFA